MRKLPVVWITLPAFGGVLFVALAVLLFARVDEKRKGRGETVAEHPVHLALPHEAVLAGWRVGNGAEVEAGAPLADLNLEECGRELANLNLRVEAGQAALASLERERTRLLPGVLAQTAVTHALEIEKARAQWEEAELNLKVNQELHAQEMIPIVVLKKAEKAVEVRRAEMRQAESRLAQFEREAPIRTEALEREARTLEGQLQELGHRVGALERQMALPVLVSPRAGVVTGIRKQAGDRAAAGEVLCVVTDPGDLLFAARLKSSDLPRLAEGQRAILTFEAFPHPPFERIEGTVVRPPLPEKDGVVLVYIAPAKKTILRDGGGEPHRLLPGLAGEARVIVRGGVAPAELLLDKWGR